MPAQGFVLEGPALPLGASLEIQMVKNLPAMQEIWVQSLHWEDPLEKEMAIHSSILAGEIPWVSHGLEKAWWATVHGVTESDKTWQLNNNNST